MTFKLTIFEAKPEVYDRGTHELLRQVAEVQERKFQHGGKAMPIKRLQESEAPARERRSGGVAEIAEVIEELKKIGDKRFFLQVEPCAATVERYKDVKAGVLRTLCSALKRRFADDGLNTNYDAYVSENTKSVVVCRPDGWKAGQAAMPTPAPAKK